MPGVRTDYSGLGTSPISKTIAQNWMVDPRNVLRKNVLRDLNSIAGKAAITIDKVKEYGFACGSVMNTCKYAGYLTYKLDGLPPGNAHRSLNRMDLTIAIVNTAPLDVVVDVAESPDTTPVQAGNLTENTAPPAARSPIVT
jgi:hypothetical protein